MKERSPHQQPPAWTPAFLAAPMIPHPALGNPDLTTPELFGLSIMSALSIAGIHSAINPSVFTLLTFATKPEAKDRAMKGLWIGLFAGTLASGALYFVFKRWVPVVIAEATALGLFGVGVWAINHPPANSIPPIEQQTTLPAVPAQATAQGA